MNDFIEDLRTGRAIVYEDNALIAISKPSGIPSIPERKPSGNDLLSILSSERKEKFYVVHRLDKDVSGVILFAKNQEVHRILNRLFESRLVEKTYIALVHGVIENKEMWIDAPIRRFGSGRMGVDYKKGKPSITHFKVIRRFKYYSLLKVLPKTGRSHQIRVHLYHVGHPIVGDKLYGDASVRRNPFKRCETRVPEGLITVTPRIMLHSLSLKIPDSAFGRPLFFKSFLPEDFRFILRNIERA